MCACTCTRAVCDGVGGTERVRARVCTSVHTTGNARAGSNSHSELEEGGNGKSSKRRSEGHKGALLTLPFPASRPSWGGAGSVSQLPGRPRRGSVAPWLHGSEAPGPPHPSACLFMNTTLRREKKMQKEVGGWRNKTKQNRRQRGKRKRKERELNH